MSTPDDPTFERALRAWIDDGHRQPQPRVVAQARAAMHRAVAAGVPQPRRSLLGLRRRLGFVPQGPRLRTRRAVLAFSTGLLGAAAAVGAVGWNAPAGSPLHSIRVAREDVTLKVAGSAELRMAYAEARLHDASAMSTGDSAASLAEARRLLDEARGELPSDHSSPLWSRWETDERQLSDDEARVQQPGAPGGEDSRGSGASPNPGSAATTPPPGDGRPGGGEDGSRPGSRPAPSPEPRDSEAGHTTPRPGASPAPEH